MSALQSAASLFVIIAGIAAILLAAYVLARSRTSSVLRGEVVAWQGKCERLQNELNLCKDEAHAKDIEIVDLRGKTDLTELMKGQAAMVANQAQILLLAADTQKSLGQIVSTMQAMERRLDKGLIMDKPGG